MCNCISLPPSSMSSRALKRSEHRDNPTPVLPLELFLYIASMFPLFFESENDIEGFLHFERQDALRALSQTCRHLRNTFLPLLWELFEVYHSRNGLDWTQGLVAKLVRRSEGLIENASLATLVRFNIPAFPRLSGTLIPFDQVCLCSYPTPG
jgi:hypothetical protein